MTIANVPVLSSALGRALLISNDEATIAQVSESTRQLDTVLEVCPSVASALRLLSQQKFEAAFVDLWLGGDVKTVLEKVRCSPSNRTAVIFTISDSDEETVGALKGGSNFVVRRPLSPAVIDKSLKVGYGFIVRERRRYFRCPVQIPASIRGGGMQEINGMVVNISEGGIGVTVSATLKAGIKVMVQFVLPGRPSQFAAQATTCWCEDRYVGLQFVSLAPQLESELQQWLSSKLEESLPASVADKFRNLGNAPV